MCFQIVGKQGTRSVVHAQLKEREVLEEDHQKVDRAFPEQCERYELRQDQSGHISAVQLDPI